MDHLPRLMPTSAEGETFAGVTYHLDGELVPVLTVDVSRRGIFFEHHILLWKHPTVRIGIMPMKPDDVMEFVIDRTSIISD